MNTNKGYHKDNKIKKDNLKVHQKTKQYHKSTNSIHPNSVNQEAGKYDDSKANDLADQKNTIKSYKKEADYSYSLGAFPTYELLKAKPNKVRKILLHTSYTDISEVMKLCTESKIPFEYNDKLISKISDKENCFVAGVFEKYDSELEENRPHIVLVNPSNMGNLGTILRTAVGFGIYDIAIIQPACDIFNPKTVRSSMGALFRLSHQFFSSFSEYRSLYPQHEVFTFMLNGEKTLSINESPKSELYSLVFGNEATGLDDSFLNVGTSIFIPQSKDVDSLNLTIAVGIGAYVFQNQRK